MSQEICHRAMFVVLGRGGPGVRTVGPLIVNFLREGGAGAA
jgi:hypothetical protein